MIRKLIPFLLVVLISSVVCTAQALTKPLTSRELVALVYELPKHPERRDEVVLEIRNRGIGFPLTEGMRSLVATKSGSDPLLRRTLEEAERRRVNPTASARPPDAEAQELLDRTRAATLAAAASMPDFIVKQLIKRSYAFGTTSNWIPQDNLTIAVGFRANAGEEYKVLAVNGMPLGQEATQKRDYSKDVAPGATSSGVEYISAVADVFKPESKTVFNFADTDIVLGRRTLVFEYQIEQPLSNLNLRADAATVTVGSRGRVWIDRETNRVLRFEQVATDIPSGFPITAASTLIDYDWVTIGENKFLLPTHSEVLLTRVDSRMSRQSRNEIRFRGYQKFGAELKVIDEIDEKDFPPDKPEKP
jgi:lipoprotein signal peptidase